LFIGDLHVINGIEAQLIDRLLYGRFVLTFLFQYENKIEELIDELFKACFEILNKKALINK
jgi:hypothetical protein